MGREYLATRLITGSDKAPPKTSWWPRHCRLAQGYMDARMDGRQGELKTIEDTAIRCAEEFETLCFGSPNFVMLEHTELELNLVDASVSGNIEKVGYIGDKLGSNMRALVREFGERFPNFPSRRYAYLLAQHVLNFTAAVEARLRGDAASEILMASARHKNTVNLAGFTTEWVV